MTTQTEYDGIWVMAEYRAGLPQPITFELLGKGRELASKLGTHLTCVALGHQIEDAQEMIYGGADRVYLVDDPALGHFMVEPYLNTLEFLVKKYKPTILIAGATTTGRTLMPALAARLKTGLTADCTGLDIDPETGLLLQTRPAIGGNVMATIKTPYARPQMATFRPKTAVPFPRDISRTGEIIKETIDGRLLESRIRFLGVEEDESGEVSLQDSEVIVSGGRGLSRPENFELLRSLARLLNGAVGASRVCVDQGWISYPHQIGLSGKTVSPRLYLAVGISGSVQHIAGMQTSETIVAINKDPDAPIFKIADFGIVGNLFEILPLLIERLKNRGINGKGGA
ncbi:MAG: electron transfer flavoprotein subunit alpha/FixB family protein [Firmicutes bacterium]|nr:electron transfer flavoprotein subunit alpha/FixB family protein [Bacillota bacterium]